MTDRRRSIEIRPDGTWFDYAVLRDFLGDWDRKAPKRRRVERLSTNDPALQMEGRR